MRKLPFLLAAGTFAFPALILSFAPAASAETTLATIIIGGRIVPFQVKPYLGPDGAAMAPVDAVQLLGAKYTPDGDKLVTVTAANGRKMQWPCTIVGGRYCVPFAKVAEALGGAVDWKASTQTLTVRAKLEMVRQDAGALTIYSSYPVYYSVKRIDNPERLYVDLFGMDLSTTPASIPSGSGGVTHIRSGQIDYQTVRITIDLKQGMPFKVESGIQTNTVRVALGDAGHSVHPSPIVRPVPIIRPVPVAAVPHPAAPLPVTSSAVTITNVACKVISPALTQVAITTTGEAHYSTERLDSPSRLAFDLVGASVDKRLQPTESLDNPVIKSIRIGQFLTEKTTFGRVVLDLSHMVGFSVDTRPVMGGMTYLINIVTGDSVPVISAPAAPIVISEGGLSPQAVNGSLSGKLIVVDPGHGGTDSGARDEFRSGHVYEKDITLAIGRRLRDTLERSGATVLMTRNDDTLPSVMARPMLANSHHADLFVSIHCDSSGGQNTHSGTTVYFHAHSGTCRQMAADIGRRVSETAGIGYNGIKSDTIRFVTGFGVLRGSMMPAVLVETGYMNNDSDLAKLRDDAIQQKIAEGITAGLKDFLADQRAGARSASGGENAARSAY